MDDIIQAAEWLSLRGAAQSNKNNTSSSMVLCALCSWLFFCLSFCPSSRAMRLPESHLVLVVHIVCSRAGASKVSIFGDSSGCLWNVICVVFGMRFASLWFFWVDFETILIPFGNHLGAILEFASWLLPCRSMLTVTKNHDSGFQFRAPFWAT